MRELQAIVETYKQIKDSNQRAALAAVVSQKLFSRLPA